MDIETARKLFNLYDPRPSLTCEEITLFDQAIEVLEDNGMLDDVGNLIDEDE